ncbi:MAG: hypothetical protein WA118_01410 [Carboxydocellales bacterium]
MLLRYSTMSAFTGTGIRPGIMHVYGEQVSDLGQHPGVLGAGWEWLCRQGHDPRGPKRRGPESNRYGR